MQENVNETMQQLNDLSNQTRSITLSGNQIFTQTINGITPDSITVRATTKNNVVVSKWYIDDEINTAYVSDDNSSITIPAVFMTDKNSIQIRAENDDATVYDVFSIYKIKENDESITSYILSSNGDYFSRNDSSINSTVLTCVIYYGSQQITANSYEWFMIKDNDDGWESIGTGESITVQLNSFDTKTRVRCQFDI